jgi:WhiB family transcriptional regulator, redox-sensing transcriptional regulator
MDQEVWEWMDRAACRDGVEGADWFADRGTPEFIRAITVCQGCPVAAECFTAAVERDEKYGIWGGVSAVERGWHRRRLDEVQRPVMARA